MKILSRYKLFSFLGNKRCTKFLFNIQSPVETVKATSETAMREVIAKSQIQSILTEGRSNIEVEVQEITQQILDEYGSEYRLLKCKRRKPILLMVKLLMPSEMFKLLEQIKKDQKNEAEAYANDVIPRARGDAEKFFKKLKLIKKRY